MTCSMGYTSIGCTKILETIWITESNRMVIGKIGVKLVSFPTQYHDAPSGQVRRNISATLSVELDDIRAQKQNSKQVTVLKSVILKRVQPANNAKPIRAHIQFRLNC